MTEDTNAFIPLYMLMATALGFMIGLALGDETRRRKNAEDKVDELSEKLQQFDLAGPAPRQQLRRILVIVSDTHKKLSAVSKGIRKPTA